MLHLLAADVGQHAARASRSRRRGRAARSSSPARSASLRSPSRPRASSARSWRRCRVVGGEPGESGRASPSAPARTAGGIRAARSAGSRAGRSRRRAATCTRSFSLLRAMARSPRRSRRRGRVLVRRLADRRASPGRRAPPAEGDHVAAKTRRKLIVRPCPKLAPSRNHAPCRGAAAMIRIAIIDDHAIVRAGLRQFLLRAGRPHGRGRGRERPRSGRHRPQGPGRRPRHGPLDARPERRRCARRDQGPRARPAGADPERLPGGALRDDTAAPGGERLPEQGVRSRGDRQGDPHRLPRPQVHHRRRCRAARRRPAAGAATSRLTSSSPSASSRCSCGSPRARRSATWPTACR